MCKSRQTGLKSQVWHLLAFWARASHLTSLSLFSQLSERENNLLCRSFVKLLDFIYIHIYKHIHTHICSVQVSLYLSYYFWPQWNHRLWSTNGEASVPAVKSSNRFLNHFMVLIFKDVKSWHSSCPQGADNFVEEGCCMHKNSRTRHSLSSPQCGADSGCTRELSLPGFCLPCSCPAHQCGFWLLLMRECVEVGGGVYRFRGRGSCGNK